MNKKIKKEFIILGVVIIVLLFYLILKKSDSVHYDIPDVKPIEKEDIGKVEITLKGKTIVLNKKEDKWVVGEKHYIADDGKVKNILETIAGLSLSEMVSASKNYNPYELDEEKKIAVKAYKEDNAVREFDIGKQASTFGHTFVKLAGDDNVYHAEKSFRGYFEQKLDDLRDKKVMKFDKDEISEVYLKSEDIEYRFTKKVTIDKPAPAQTQKGEEDKADTPPPAPEEKIQWLTQDSKEGDKTKLDSFINQLADLSCDKYMEDTEVKDFKDKKPLFTLTLKGSKDYTLTLFEKLGEGHVDKDKFTAVSSENAYPFLLPGHKGDNFIKDAKELLKEEKKEEKKK